MKRYKNLIFLLAVILISACESESILQPPDNNHLGLDEILDHMPFDQFNEYSKAIFKNANGKQFAFNLTIDEDVFDISTGEDIYSTNQITFGYRTGFDLEIPEITIIAKIDSLHDRGYTELLICSTSVLISSFSQNPKLTIIPSQSYLSTILNEEFVWMGETFENVYSNVLIEENNPSNVKIFYQSPNGIIGFADALNESWIFDRYE